MSDEEKQEDVLKKLREVRRKLQESLSEDTKSGIEESEKVDTSKILVEGQAELEKQDKAEQIKARSKALDKKKPKLYKAGKGPKKKKLKKAPTKTGLSARKMAGIQKRIQQKVSQRQSMSKKKKTLLVIAMVIAAA
ncbi:MAG: hypothetical protein GF364_18295, partial [Candidatus Lokiarchaeota archaeon]|nr:hypothetical protein [Candidatus Lokiarchaeota archaeon]